MTGVSLGSEASSGGGRGFSSLSLLLPPPRNLDLRVWCESLDVDGGRGGGISDGEIDVGLPPAGL